MSQFTKVIVKPFAIDSETTAKIVTLHQKFFTLDQEKIIEYLQPRDEIHLYYHKRSKALAATIGIQWFEYEKYVIMYLGNAVVDNEFQKYGVLTSSIYICLLRMCYQYKGKEKFVISMATSPDAFSFYKKLKHFWPNMNSDVPREIKQKLRTFCQGYCGDEFIEKDNLFIAKNMHHSFHLRDEYYEKTLVADDSFSQWFRSVNPNYKQGEQVVCIAAVDKINVKVIKKAFLQRIWRAVLPDHMHHNRKTTYKNVAKIFIYILVFFSFSFEAAHLWWG